MKLFDIPKCKYCCSRDTEIAVINGLETTVCKCCGEVSKTLSQSVQDAVAMQMKSGWGSRVAAGR